ncbi:MAG TPA: GAF and ANTAR domain-containing protein [Euzebyales bacterium]|nr:GAF and ANTAR domain-containing protein [Euzebyales bacterium]
MTGTQTRGIDPAPEEAPSDGVDHRAFWKVLERFAGTLVDRYELDEVLETLGGHMRRVLGVAGAGVMLADDDNHLRCTSTSDGVLKELEALQIELDEGPCLLAYRSAEIVLAEDLRGDERFPRFGPRAVGAGMSAVYSFPMHLDRTVFGALNLYRGEPGPFTEDQIEVGETFANVATCYLTNARDVEHKDLLTQQLQQALDSRVVIEQAKGYVAAVLQIDVRDAYELLRGYARARQVRARVIARGLVHGDLDPRDLRQR